MTGPIVNASATNIAGNDNADTNANDSLIPVLPLSTSTMPAMPGLIPTSGVCGSPSAGAIPSRCGYGPRLPSLVISAWAKTNFVDHSVTDQTSSLRFIEDNWGLQSIDEPEKPAGLGSFDRLAGSVMNMFDFDNQPNSRRLILDPLSGQLVAGKCSPLQQPLRLSALARLAKSSVGNRSPVASFVSRVSLELPARARFGNLTSRSN